MAKNIDLSELGLIEQYQHAFATHGDSPAGVLWPRGRQSLRFEALTRHFSEEGFSVLDYGCGLAHLKEFLDKRFDKYEYYGVDIVPEFVDTVKIKYPDANVKLIKSHRDVYTIVDHIVISGTFNLLGGKDRLTYEKQIQEALLNLFNFARVSLAVNFMTHRVDFIQPQAFHMNVEIIMDFMRRCLTPRLRLDESYMPYEFSIIGFKNHEIIRPENIYR